MALNPATAYQAFDARRLYRRRDQEELQWARERHEQFRKDLQMHRFSQGAEALGGVFSIMQTRALSGYEERAARTAYQAQVAGFDARSVGIGASASAAGSAARSAEVGLAAGLRVLAAEEAELDRAVERRRRVLGGAGDALQTEMEFRRELFGVEVAERRRETRRRIGGELAAQASRGARGSASYVASIEESEAERVEIRIKNLQQAAQQAGLLARQEELGAEEEQMEADKTAARARIRSQRETLQRRTIEAYSSAMAGLGQAQANRAANQAARQAARKAYQLGRQKRKWGRRGAYVSGATQIAGALRGLG